MVVYPVPLRDFDKAVDAYAGLNDSNVAQITKKLADLGIVAGAGQAVTSQNPHHVPMDLGEYVLGKHTRGVDAASLV